MQEILVMTSAYPPVRPTVRVEGDGSVRAIFLGGKSHGRIAFGNLRVSGGKSY